MELKKKSKLLTHEMCVDDVEEVNRKQQQCNKKITISRRKNYVISQEKP